MLYDSNDICDASLAPEKVIIDLADDEIQDTQIAENSFPTLELGSKESIWNCLSDNMS